MPNPAANTAFLPDNAPRTELTLRGLILGILITLLFTAANVYFGLKAGLTFATSIPAAVISMAILRNMRGVTIQENNIVQTVASAAGTLSSIIFVLPGLVMIGWWTGFPYWVSFAICALGGILGVMYSIPLRRALVTNSDLPYPEGVACAELLKIGEPGEGQSAESAAEASRAGLLAVIWGSVVSAAFYVVVQTRVFASDVLHYFRIGDKGAATGYDFSLSFALFAVGHLVGLWVGIAILTGALISWAGAVPYLVMQHAVAGDAATVTDAVWRSQVRFIGAGTIGVAAIWTLVKLVMPVVTGLRSAMTASRIRKAGQSATLPRTEQDIPIGWVGLITLICLAPIGLLLAKGWLKPDFDLAASGLGDHMLLLVGGGLLFVAVMSFFVSAVCGYMAGLIGSSNSPLSGVGILVVIGAALLLVVGIDPAVRTASGPALVAFALFVTSIVFAVATIANNNLQDLKTGQLVDATPWKQQVALIIGVIAGAAIIPPIMTLLNQAWGFAGAPHAGPHALPAPQAALISALAQGVIQGKLNWDMIGIGAVIGIGIIVLDAVLRGTTKFASLPPLAVGLGIYLPTSVTLMTATGAVVGWWFDRRADRKSKNPEATKQLGVLLASGMIVGESILGVLVAGLVVFWKQDPLVLVGDAFANGSAVWIGGAAFVAIIAMLYMWLVKLSRKTQA